MSDFRYQPYYCEENAWWLCQRAELGEGQRDVVFITNARKHCLLSEQRAAAPGESVVWDYHVIVVADGRVWDLDTRLEIPVTIADYLDATFPELPEEMSHMAPMFRVVPAAEIVKSFHTDRSHMLKEDGAWIQPPPTWEPPTTDGQANQLRYVDLEDDVAGVVLSLDELRAHYSK